MDEQKDKRDKPQKEVKLEEFEANYFMHSLAHKLFLTKSATFQLRNFALSTNLQRVARVQRYY